MAGDVWTVLRNQGLFRGKSTSCEFPPLIYPKQGTRLIISDPCTAKYVLNSPLFPMGASHEKAANFLIGYGSIVLAHGTIPTNSLFLQLNTAQVTDTGNCAI
jgi:hypothetical protein